MQWSDLERFKEECRFDLLKGVGECTKGNLCKQQGEVFGGDERRPGTPGKGLLWSFRTRPGGILV